MATGISKTRWKGQTQRPARSHVTPQLVYESKRPESEILATQPANLVVTWSRSLNNRLYYADNLPVLAELLRDSGVRGKVKLIYIDPPYATSSIFQSRNEKDAYTDLLGGAEYLEFLRERLVLLRELLADDGSIYVHLDENMAFHVKIMMDEVFRRENFRNWITRKKCNPKNYTRKTYGNISDYILFYTKTENYIWHRPVEVWTPERAIKEYSYVEEGTGRRYKKVPIHAPGIRNGETGKPWRGMLPPPGKHWQYTPDKLDEMDARGEIYWSPNGNPRRKVYLDESEGIPVQDIWLDFRDAHNQNIDITGYPTEKNPDLIAQIIKASSNEGDLILDCFSGSGTTLAVASQLNRRWIGVDNSSEAIKTTLHRFVNGTQPMGDYVSARNGQKNDSDAGETIPLFTFTPDTVVQSNQSYTPITDFSLLCEEQRVADIAIALKEWNKSVDKITGKPMVKDQTSSFGSSKPIKKKAQKSSRQKSKVRRK